MPGISQLPPDAMVTFQPQAFVKAMIPEMAQAEVHGFWNTNIRDLNDGSFESRRIATSVVRREVQDGVDALKGLFRGELAHPGDTIENGYATANGVERPWVGTKQQLDHLIGGLEALYARRGESAGARVQGARPDTEAAAQSRYAALYATYHTPAAEEQLGASGVIKAR